jgi:alpha,alpha-trehalase
VNRVCRLFLFLIPILFLAVVSNAQPHCRELFLHSGSSIERSGQLQPIQIHKAPAKALREPLFEEARRLGLEDDFKVFADLAERNLTQVQKAEIRLRSISIENQEGRQEAVRFLIEHLYEREPPLLSVSMPELASRWTTKDSKHRSTFEHIEKMWSVLTRRTRRFSRSSLIPLPFPFLIPGARFQEGYYWDSYFAFSALLRTGRERIVRGQIDNFLFLLKNYSLIPNGTRDYYLSRSQPPLISQMVREYIEFEISKGPLKQDLMDWLRNDALPLIRKDYETFWMNSATRYDSKTGLNRHYDSENSARPERHSSDKEEQIAKTYRDVRAEAESGKDFTDAFQGEATQTAGVLLNSILYGVEKNLAWMSQIVGQNGKSFQSAAARRQRSMNKYLWDETAGVFRDYNLRTRHQSRVLTADSFAALDAGLVDRRQALLIKQSLIHLERAGGIMSSATFSGKQWDAPYGWAPHHYFAISGLKKYHFESDARRLAQKWVDSIDRIFVATGKILEKIDAETGRPPVETGGKYPTQDGFLWSNGLYVWALTKILNVDIERLP